ncbi:MAG TPA: hypothetical protein VJI46_05380 [Candidatus Nanoarchaeia archaeon]|nr:hypothetical protein [Candidatus Nanoarchaeia archaeon]
MNARQHILRSVVGEIPRLLSLLDRSKTSATYGCFDRNYWQYKIVDFPSARCQEAALTLALLYNLKSKENPYYHQSNIMEWINAALRFWQMMQNKNGSFNEWYPNEHSFVATAFSTYAVTETLLELGNVEGSIIKSIKKSASWMMKHSEMKVLNQQAGSAIALYNSYLTTKEEKFKRGAEKKIDAILASQTNEGWWYEYEGPDIGYLSLMIDYLSKYYSKSRDKRVLAAIKRAASFLKYFIHPDGTVGGCYASRNTKYLMPGGFYSISGQCIDAADICFMLDKGLGISLPTFDDRYLTYIAYNWLQAFKNYRKCKGSLPQHSLKKTFPLAGIVVWSTPDFYLIVNASKGGSFSLFTKKNAFSESGIIQSTGNFFLSSGRISLQNKIIEDNNALKIKACFFPLKPNLMDTKKLIALRAFQLTLGKSGCINKAVKGILRGMLISKKGSGRFKLNREITLNSHATIIDRIELHPKAKEIFLGQEFSELYVPSSQYFHIQELQNRGFKIKVNGRKDIKVIRQISKSGVVSVKVI